MSDRKRKPYLWISMFSLAGLLFGFVIFADEIETSSLSAIGAFIGLAIEFIFRNTEIQLWIKIIGNIVIGIMLLLLLPTLYMILLVPLAVDEADLSIKYLFETLCYYLPIITTIISV